MFIILFVLISSLKLNVEYIEEILINEISACVSTKNVDPQVFNFEFNMT